MLSLTYSISDQDFRTTKSLGILNVSQQVLAHLVQHPELQSLTVLTNLTHGRDTTVSAKARFLMHNEAIAGRLHRIWWDQWRLYAVARQAGDQWLFLPKGFASFVRKCPNKLAVYVHDTILESYYSTHPGLSAFELAYFRYCLTATIRQARVIFTNSNFTAMEVKRAAERRCLKPPKVITIGMGTELRQCEKLPGENRILVLAGAWPHKRTDLAVKYLTQWQAKTGFQGTIDWVGRLPQEMTLPPYPNWKLHCRLPEPDFRRLLGRSRALVFFSDYEGFGMPPVEAISHGACPVYSDIAATQEIMAGAGCAFQNDSYESFAAALETALRTPPAQLHNWQEALMARFNWKLTCSKLVEALLTS